MGKISGPVLKQESSRRSFPAAPDQQNDTRRRFIDELEADISAHASSGSGKSSSPTGGFSEQLQISRETEAASSVMWTLRLLLMMVELTLEVRLQNRRRQSRFGMWSKELNSDLVATCSCHLFSELFLSSAFSSVGAWLIPPY